MIKFFFSSNKYVKFLKQFWKYVMEICVLYECY